MTKQSAISTLWFGGQGLVALGQFECLDRPSMLIADGEALYAVGEIDAERSGSGVVLRTVNNAKPEVPEVRRSITFGRGRAFSVAQLDPGEIAIDGESG